MNLRTLKVKIIKRSFGAPTWWDNHIGEIFEVIRFPKESYYKVIENGQITNKIISINCAKIIK